MNREGYKNTYTKKNYSRGAMRTRDFVYEAVVARSCEVCGKLLERKISKNLRPEQWRNFLKRKTCGRNPDGTFSECMIKNHIGENNPKWRGGIPTLTCIDCGKERKHYLSEDREHTQQYCWDCHLKRCSDRFSNKTTEQKRLGGKRLKKYWETHKRIAHNKIYDTCQEKDCTNKHLAKGMCNKHYSRIYRKK